MKKLIIICPKCTKKMKISNRIAKYKCPHCSTIYKFNFFKFIFLNIENFFMNIINKIIIKFNNFVNTYKYMKQVRNHMKNNPNWSNYKKQQEEEKSYQSKKSFFSKFKR